MISYAEARRRISEAALARPAVSDETIPLSQSLGRISASELFGRDPIPPFDNSSMDGYALAAAKAHGASNAPTTLPVLGVILAGDAPRCQAESGVWKIMTGAPIPAGCDAVVPVERTRELDGGRAVEILQAGAGVSFYNRLLVANLPRALGVPAFANDPRFQAHLKERAKEDERLREVY